MKVVYSDKHALHDPAFFLVRGERRDSAEKPARADILLKAARDGGHDIVPPAYTGLVPVLAVHTPEYVDFLQVAQREWRKLDGSGPEVIPNVHPVRYRGSYPRAIAGRALPLARLGSAQARETTGAPERLQDGQVECRRRRLHPRQAGRAIGSPNGDRRLRADDVNEGDLPCSGDPFFCTPDPNQGGAASRHLLSGRLEWRRPGQSLTQQVFASLRTNRFTDAFVARTAKGGLAASFAASASVNGRSCSPGTT